MRGPMVDGHGNFGSVDGDGALTETMESRYLDGRVLLFAEIPEDGAVSDISDGLFLFVPDVQQEAALQDMEKDGSHCAVTNLLPSRIRVILYRTDDPNSTESRRTTAQSLWINCPGGAEEDLPTVVLQQGGEQS